MDVIEKKDTTLKRLFEQSFDDKWDTVNNRFPTDLVCIVHESKNPNPIGFVCIHNDSPFEYNNERGIYLYNLCVAPEKRGQKAGTELLKYITGYKPVVQLHADLTRYSPGWLESLNFQPGEIRGRYMEYTYVRGQHCEKKSEDSTKRVNAIINNPHYDFVENIIYMDPLY